MNIYKLQNSRPTIRILVSANYPVLWIGRWQFCINHPSDWVACTRKAVHANALVVSHPVSLWFRQSLDIGQISGPKWFWLLAMLSGGARGRHRAYARTQDTGSALDIGGENDIIHVYQNPISFVVDAELDIRWLCAFNESAITVAKACMCARACVHVLIYISIIILINRIECFSFKDFSGDTTARTHAYQNYIWYNFNGAHFSSAAWTGIDLNGYVWVCICLFASVDKYIKETWGPGRLSVSWFSIA